MTIISKIELGKNAKKAFLEKVYPKMHAYVTVHGYSPSKTPVLAAVQVANIVENYKKQFRDKRKKMFQFDDDFNHFQGTEAFEEEQKYYIEEQEQAAGFEGFGGEDVEMLESLVETLMETPEGFDIKKTIGSVAKLGSSVAGATPYGAAAKMGGKLIGGAVKSIGGSAKKKVDTKKSTVASAGAVNNNAALMAAQAKAMKAGVPNATIDKVMKANRENLEKVGNTIISKNAEQQTKVLNELTKTFQASQVKETANNWQKIAAVAVILLVLGYVAVKVS